MTRQRRLKLSLFIAFALPLGQACANLPVINWAKNNAPPFYIIEGPLANYGFGDQMQILLEAALPQFEHRSLPMPLPRLNHYWSQGKNYCFSTMIHEAVPADSDYLLSQPNVYYLPHGIITSKHPSKPSRSLADIIEARQWRAGIASNRTFGATIDALLKEKPEDFHLYERPGADGLRSLFEMLLAERIDFVIDYAYVFNYYQQFPDFTGNIEFTPIDEVNDQGVLGAIGCTNNAWGQEVIEQINEALNTLLKNPTYQALMLRWQAQPGQEEDYQAAFLKRVAPGPEPEPAADTAHQEGEHTGE